MSISGVDVSFCDTCHHRGEIISSEGGGTYCARTGLDFMSEMMKGMAEVRLPVFRGLDPVSETTVGEAAVSFGAGMLSDVVRCIEVVSAGGEPIVG